MAALSTRELVEHAKDAMLKLCVFLELSDDATQEICDGEQVLLESVKIALFNANTTLERQVIAAAFCARSVSTHMEANSHGKKQVGHVHFKYKIAHAFGHSPLVRTDQLGAQKC
jgi:hypothetical protein